MDNLEDLYIYCREKITEYPNAAEDVMAFYVLAEMEVKDGCNEAHEVELAHFDIDDLIQVYKANTK